MRKLAAILLIFILLFNLCGYRMVIAGLQNKADEQLGLSLDNNEYNEYQLIEIRIALNMPYQERYTEFERHYGEINIDGKAYTYVKRKIEGDVLVLKCIANQLKQELKKTADDWVKSNSGQDQENNSKKQTSFFSKIFSGDYDDKNQFSLLTVNDISNNILTTAYSAALNDVLIKTPHQPPETFLSLL